MNIEGSVLGIDVGWSQKKKSSAVCRLSWSDREVGGILLIVVLETTPVEDVEIARINHT